jgi:ankyrin repeat protein
MGRTDLATLLLYNGADINTKDKDGDTLLAITPMYNQELIDLLKALGAKEE